MPRPLLIRYLIALPPSILDACNLKGNRLFWNPLKHNILGLEDHEHGRMPKPSR